ncbi:MAG: substrate-binding domain-containing protein [Candidatus Eiseniibacteriota bacterium]
MRAVIARTETRPTRRRRLLPIATALLLTAVGGTSAQAETGGAADKRLTLAAAASLDDSGFLDYILPLFKQATGIVVTVRAQPSGPALQLARDGKVDAVLLDDYDQEMKAVEDGSCIDRRDIMYSDLVLIGPKVDPAGVQGMTSIVDAVRLIASSQSLFIARGDDSGIALTERSIWDEAQIAVGGEATRAWYLVSGGDMTRTLGMAATRNGYTLTDRPSWLRLRNRGRLDILVQDDPRLVVQFGAMAVNPAKHPTVHAAAAKAFVEWLSSKDGQDAILRFKLQDEVPYLPNYGERGG